MNYDLMKTGFSLNLIACNVRRENFSPIVVEISTLIVPKFNLN